ncbi:3-hydroxyacyl-CoA dehydrogenase family protein [Fictibacillus nanhaiensis]|uniref:3-hydroxyacyl-CoA dehydrogenase family protein n=1 Tax=Fictibacillus nanhaiensis TaxID=742169 RepID=UPI003C23C067
MNIGVIGAGVMGMGVAQSLAQSGHEVTLIDIAEEILNSAKKKIHNNVRFHALFNKDFNKTADEVLSLITTTTNYSELSDADFIIENVPEDWDIKKSVYEKIIKISKGDCIFLVNTSCISITKIASLTDRPDRVFGVHFMNPVPVKKTVEGIKGYHTSDVTIRHTNDLLASMGKEIIVVNDYPGFVSNRISHLLMNEAAYVVQDQVADPAQVDDIFVKCYGHTMGPLATADLIGLDTVVNSLDILYDSYQDSKFRVCPLLRKMVDAGLHGRKSGQGFFEYETEEMFIK